MRGIVNTPTGEARVRLAEQPSEPIPAPNEVLLEVECFGLNRGELGLLAMRPEGWRPGQDVAGVVRAAAADGSGPAAGTRVTALAEQAGWAELVAVPVRRVASLPEHVDIAAAATLGISGRTALRTIDMCGSLLGRRVLVTGAAGGVGRLQTQLAANAGASVTAVTRRPQAKSELSALGATDVAVSTDAPAGLFDVVLDGVGGRSLSAALRKVAPGGTVVLYGASDTGSAELNLFDFVGHDNAIIRSYLGGPGDVGADLATLVGLVATGRLTPRIGLRTGWEHINNALDALADGRVDGKAVVNVTEAYQEAS